MNPSVQQSLQALLQQQGVGGQLLNANPQPGQFTPYQRQSMNIPRGPQVSPQYGGPPSAVPPGVIAPPPGIPSSPPGNAPINPPPTQQVSAPPPSAP